MTKNKINVLLRGHVRNSFENTKLINFLKELSIEYDLIIKVQTWSCQECKKENTWKNINDNNRKITKKEIKNYFNEFNIKDNDIRILDDSIITHFGSVDGCVGTCKQPKLGWKNMWYGIYEGVNMFNNNLFLLNLRLDYFNIVQSRNYFNDHIRNYIKIVIINNLKGIHFYKNHNEFGVDNMYLGMVKYHKKLSFLFHRTLDNIIKNISFTNAEFLVPKISDKFLEKDDINLLVISRYNEDLDWLKKIIDNRIISQILIYNKGVRNLNFSHKKIRILNVENIGREGGTYLKYILDNYTTLPDNIWFTQADPFIHSPDFLNFFSKRNYIKYMNSNIFSLTTELGYSDTLHNAEYLNLFNLNKDCKSSLYLINKNNHNLVGHCQKFDKLHQKFVIDQYYDIYKTNKIEYNIFEKDPKLYIVYVWSACFFVKRDSILLNSYNFYYKLKNFLYDGGYHLDNRRPHCQRLQAGIQGFILERLWYYIFSHESFNSLKDFYCKYLVGDNFSNYNLKSNICELIKLDDYEIIQDDDNIVVFKDKSNEIRKIPGIKIIANVFHTEKYSSFNEMIMLLFK